MGEGLDVFLDAFFALSKDRHFATVLVPVDGGKAKLLRDEGPIPWSSIERYAVAHEMDGELKLDLHYIVGELDRAWLKFMVAQRSSESEAEESDEDESAPRPGMRGRRNGRRQPEKG